MKNKMKIKQEQKNRRHARVRGSVSGTGERPRFSFFRSNNNIYAQIVDDEKGITLVSASSLKSSTSKREKAKEVGEMIAKEAIKKNIKKVVFDRGSFSYTGLVKECADSARKAGLIM